MTSASPYFGLEVQPAMRSTVTVKANLAHQGPPAMLVAFVSFRVTKMVIYKVAHKTQLFFFSSARTTLSHLCHCLSTLTSRAQLHRDKIIMLIKSYINYFC